jgi:3-phenylpropionate/trans-cinnamate dioxygenase ferredoxin reductase component
MATPPTFAIIGASLAGAKTAEALREQGFDGNVILFGAETHLPYERPPLSKGYLKGTEDRDSFVVHPKDWYEKQNVELRLGTEVTGLDASAHRLTTADGSEVAYDRLLIATGSTPRRLSMPGAEASNVRYLRTVDDSETLRAAIDEQARVVIVGAGWIGLEVAAAASEAGASVTVIESLDLPLLRVLGPEMATVFADLHREHGVDLRLGATLSEIRTEAGQATSVVLGDGRDVPATLLVVGIGIAPNTALAEAAGLEVDNGIVVDEALRSSDPDVFAAGDVANAQHPLLGRRIRVEHWANALNQPAVAAKAMRGEPASFDLLPYFYTDQYDLGMEYVGYVGPGDDTHVVVRGDAAGREFVAFWLDRQDRIQAGMNVNVWDVVDDVKALITANRPVDITALTDPEVPFADALQ